MIKIQIILGSTRPGRNGESVAKWAHQVAKTRKDIKVELVDLADYDLPLFDEPVSPMFAKEYTKPHTKKWSEKIAQADGYIFVTAEYNHSIPAALKNAIDCLYHEWGNKSAGFIGYGMAGGVRSIEHLRGVAGEVRMADVRESLMLSLIHDFEQFSVFKPTDRHEAQLNKVLDQVASWAGVLQPLRS